MSSSALPNSPKRLYSRAAAADGKAIYLKPLDKKQKKEARINTVFNGEYIPKEVYLKRPLSAAGMSIASSAMRGWMFEKQTATRSDED